jgi:hypothetical protein
MRLGKTQSLIVQYLKECGGRGFIGATCKAKQFNGLYLEEIERSLQALIKRQVVIKDGIGFYRLLTK